MTPRELIRQPHTTDWRITGCPVCGAQSSVTEIITLRGVPAQDGVLWESAQDARLAPTGDIQLMLCAQCGYIGNQLHDPSKVRFTGYDVSLQHSPIFRKFTEELALRLIGRYNLRAKTVLDIGCGQGYFLSTLCRLGLNHGLGFDPSYTENGGEAQPETTFIKDYYGAEYAGYAADLISCRHVIDILGDPATFLSMVRQNIGSERTPLVYFESPDASYTISNKILWNIVYEHKSWFTLDSYRALFERCGFDVLDVSRCWNDEYIGIEAIPSSPRTAHGLRATGRSEEEAASSSDAVAEMTAACRAFGEEYTRTLETWAGRLERLTAEQKRIALWGSGARGISFLNFFRASDAVQTVFDINPKRQGKFLPVSAQRVLAPECLAAEQPDVIIISNPTYEAEIRAQADALGYRGEFITL
jgi:hypothetical protein